MGTIYYSDSSSKHYWTDFDISKLRIDEQIFFQNIQFLALFLPSHSINNNKKKESQAKISNVIDKIIFEVDEKRRNSKKQIKSWFCAVFV